MSTSTKLNWHKRTDLPEEYYLLDLEFTRVVKNSQIESRPLEIALGHYQRNKLVEPIFDRYLYWDAPMSMLSSDFVRGLKLADCQDYQAYIAHGQWSEIAASLVDFLDPKIPIGGWGLSLDRATLTEAATDLPNSPLNQMTLDYFDVSDLFSHVILPGENWNQVNFAQHQIAQLWGIDTSDQHHAIFDIGMTHQILQNMLDHHLIAFHGRIPAKTVPMARLSQPVVRPQLVASQPKPAVKQPTAKPAPAAKLAVASKSTPAVKASHDDTVAPAFTIKTRTSKPAPKAHDRAASDEHDTNHELQVLREQHRQQSSKASKHETSSPAGKSRLRLKTLNGKTTELNLNQPVNYVVVYFDLDGKKKSYNGPHFGDDAAFQNRMKSLTKAQWVKLPQTNIKKANLCLALIKKSEETGSVKLINANLSKKLAQLGVPVVNVRELERATNLQPGQWQKSPVDK